VDHGDGQSTAPGMACSECNDLLVAPKSSAYLSNYEIRHIWSCNSCGHEMAVDSWLAGFLGKTLSSAEPRQQGRRANGFSPHRFACPPDKWLRNDSNKIEYEPTKCRSRCYGNGHLIPVFHGIQRTSSYSFRSDGYFGARWPPA
jgi:hypothetical protein